MYRERQGLTDDVIECLDLSVFVDNRALPCDVAGVFNPPFAMLADSIRSLQLNFLMFVPETPSVEVCINFLFFDTQMADDFFVMPLSISLISPQKVLCLAMLSVLERTAISMAAFLRCCHGMFHKSISTAFL